MLGLLDPIGNAPSWLSHYGFPVLFGLIDITAFCWIANMCPVHDLSETEISGASSTFFNFEIQFFFNYRKPKCQNTFKIYFDDIEGIFWTDFSIDNLLKDNFKIPSTTRQLFIVWHLWNLLDTWKTTRILRCFCTPQRIGNLECWKLSHHKITLQGTISHPPIP